MKIVFIIAAALLMLVLVSGEIPTKSSPARAPEPDLTVDLPESPPFPAPTSIEGSTSPAESPIEYSSPPKPITEHSPVPSPSDSPSISPSSLPDDHASTSPSPSPSSEASDLNPSDLNHSDLKGIEDEKAKGGGGGMSGGTKVGVVFGMVAAVCVVGLGGFVYKKRRENIRRSRYGYAAREIL
ncbi:unnamed protein product [Cochlearia groenlandica]